MDKQQQQLETLREIRSLMERSSRFISLSGLSGIIAGVAALAGVLAVYLYLGLSLDDPGYYQFAKETNGEANRAFYTFIMVDIIIVFVVSLLAAILLTIKKSRQQGRPVWDKISKRLLVNILIPLLAGGSYCLILLYHDQLALIAPATMIFYGMALLNAGKYTLNDVRYLGVAEIITGLIASVVIEYGLLFWAFGFGIIHIVYGIVMYFKYEK